MPDELGDYHLLSKKHLWVLLECPSHIGLITLSWIRENPTSVFLFGKEGPHWIYLHNTPDLLALFPKARQENRGLMQRNKS